MSEQVTGSSANPNKRTIYICQNEFCLEKGAQEYVEKLRQKVAEHRANLIAAGNSPSVESVESEGLDVKVCPYICFNGCDYGPIIISYPPCEWYAGVTEDDLDVIANAAFSSQGGGSEIERLQDNALDIDPDVRDVTSFVLKRKMAT